MRTRYIDCFPRAAAFFFGLPLALFLFASSAFSQAPKEQAPQEYVRVPDRQTNANVHMGPSSGQVIIVLVPKGTVLPVVSRRGEWFAVKLSPELRKLGTPMRWYKNEEQGYIHQSTVEVVKGKP